MIILETIHSLGPWGRSQVDPSLFQRQLYSSGREELPWVPQESSLETQIINGELDGKIPEGVANESRIEDSRIKAGPFETRYAYGLLQTALEDYEAGVLRQTDRNQLDLVCAVEPQGSLTGYRNGLRLGYHFENGFVESEFLQNLNQGFADTHPMVSLQNMPNQMVGNLAISFGLGGETINCAGRHSSFEALQVAMRKVKADRDQKVLLVGAFCYRLSMILNQLPLIALEGLKSQIKNQVALNEWVGVSCVRRAMKPPKGTLGIRGLHSEVLDSRKSIKDVLLDSLEYLLKSARISLLDIDLVLVDDISTGWFMDRVLDLKFFNPELIFVDVYQRLGNSFHCSFMQHLELAQTIFDIGKIPGSFREGYRDSSSFAGVQKTEEVFKGKFVLIAGLSFPDQIQLTLLEGAPSK